MLVTEVETRETLAGVESLLGRELADGETPRAEHLVKQAFLLIGSFLGLARGELPQEAHLLVAAQMVARVLQAPAGRVGVTGATTTTGPFTQNLEYAATYSDGSVWLSSSDKQMLGGGRRAQSVRMVSERFA